MPLQGLREPNDSDWLGGKPIDSEALFGSLRQARFADGWRNIPITPTTPGKFSVGVNVFTALVPIGLY